MRRNPDDYLRHGDYEQIGDGPAIRLVVPDGCYNGHPIRDNGWGQCPRCRKMATIFGCRVAGCDGMRTSKAHERECPREANADYLRARP